MNISLHNKLIKKARRYLLNKGYPIVISEMTSGTETPDVIGFNHRGYSFLIEVKTSRSDFLNDRNKSVRRVGNGMGDYRYYLVPEGLISRTEIPTNWGLLYFKTRIYQVIPSSIHNKDWREELGLFVSLVRRLNDPRKVEQVSLKRYAVKTKNRATLIVKENELGI